MAKTAEVETWEDKIRHIGQENVNSVPLGVMEMAASTDPPPYNTEEKPTKKHPTQNIGYGSTTTEIFLGWLI